MLPRRDLRSNTSQVDAMGLQTGCMERQAVDRIGPSLLSPRRRVMSAVKGRAVAQCHTSSATFTIRQNHPQPTLGDPRFEQVAMWGDAHCLPYLFSDMITSQC